MMIGVVAPIAAGVTADPVWMGEFARHLEACGFESIIMAEHTVLVTQYASVYPYDPSGRVEVAPGVRCPIRWSCWHFWPARPRRWGWPPVSSCCPTTIR